MKIHFENNQPYQLAAIDAVVDVFDGQMHSDIVREIQLSQRDQMSMLDVSARGNALGLSVTELANNTATVQQYNNLEQTIVTDYGMNFSIEMETGTGKTYVYLRTMHELRAKYGWSKFIIVVPSVAIREGVMKNLEITKDHFDQLYDKPEMRYYQWDSKKLGLVREFATNDTMQIMVITIDSFAKAQNIMNQDLEGGKPLESIRATNPIVIIDEPQNMETDIRRNAIASLNPLCTLRYSATHKNTYNLLYRLTPVDAYDQKLVKRIEVDSVMSDDAYNDAYISVLAIERNGKNGYFAKVEIDKGESVGLQRKIERLSPGDDLEQITKRSIYDGYIVDSIDMDDGSVEFTNGKIFYVGQRNESMREEIIAKQIEQTVKNHLDKQLLYKDENIKVLSLFFIDKVANYREYTDTGMAKGKFATMFEDAYTKFAAKPKYADIVKHSAEQVHNGYFAADKNGRWKDSRDSKGEGGSTKDDDGAYELIMKEKEKLLDPNVPLQFIFSHSALREGWDNPNVFNICTLNETTSEMKKRQEIGRGLRLPVRADGTRVRDDSINILTVIANESYEDFSRKLQTEIETETGVSFAGRIKDKNERKRIQLRKSLALDPSFKELWEKIKYKTVYRVNIDEQKLISRCVELLNEVTIVRPQIMTRKTIIKSMGKGMESQEKPGSSAVAGIEISKIPNILQIIQDRTGMTRQLIFTVLDRTNMIGKIPLNPEMVMDKVSEIINRAKNEMAVDGVKYERTGESYDMRLFENKELQSYLYSEASKTGAVTVDAPDKTVYDYVVVDSAVEYSFMRALEGATEVKFYVKLPSWFKIATPIGSYNPDWAVVFDGDERIYFVAETKDSNELHDNSISADERSKILSARQHFAEIGVPYAAPVRTLNDALERLK